MEGPEFDAKVMEKVLGWRILRTRVQVLDFIREHEASGLKIDSTDSFLYDLAHVQKQGHPGLVDARDVRGEGWRHSMTRWLSFSKDIGAAWVIVRHLRKDGWRLRLEESKEPGKAERRVQATFFNPDRGVSGSSQWHVLGYDGHAICEAALQAVESPKPMA